MLINVEKNFETKCLFHLAKKNENQHLQKIQELSLIIKSHAISFNKNKNENCTYTFPFFKE
jgi:hypothetical protein